jgi:hypothetical protein
MMADTFHTAAEVDEMIGGLQQQITTLQQQVKQPAEPPVPVGQKPVPGPATPAVPVSEGGDAP